MTRDTLEFLLETKFYEKRLPGLGAVVEMGGQRWELALGVSDVTTGEPFRVGDHYRIGCVTKSFTATAVLQQIDSGRLGFDDTLERFVPGIPNGERITIEQLLNMTSGVANFVGSPDWLPTRDSLSFDTPDADWPQERKVELMRIGPAVFEPGAKAEYCDSNYILLGLVLEQVTGRPAADVINGDVVASVPGLTSTEFPSVAELPDPHPTIYAFLPDGRTLRELGDMNPRVLWTTGAMTSTVDDLLIWVRELADSTLLSARSQRARLTSTHLDRRRAFHRYGLGVQCLGALLGHNSIMPGSSCAVYRYPAEDVSVAVVTNASANMDAISMEIALDLVRALYPRFIDG
ncbi:serine hydrolase domain-containing protein [Nocardia bovistercoris]|uniref:Beta-lactamase family protein n=1 Tax=Nocardia bovistercoris TaxID=2785916 RepID=A0A931N4G4_9NOCA|nr:serine hydrolase domain-containing protein [Nocardia bovistercoris]MBH0777593.1 beta-lactamase family protein [Nocardia bovistercoris]